MDRKGFHILQLIGWALVLSLQMQAQNLVPNPSFEENNGCPFNGNSWTVSSWFRVTGGKYCHECGTDGYGVPTNASGVQVARTGSAYIRLGLWAFYPALESHMVGIELAYPLDSGVKYNVQLHLSLADNLWYAVKNIGVYFFHEEPPSGLDSLLNCDPQVRYEGDAYLNDKENWMKVSGSFIAQGGERYMTIGNFDGHSGSDVLFVGGPQPPSGQPDYYKAAIYYIDDVSVVADTTTAVGEVAADQRSYKLYPNPNAGSFTLDMDIAETDVAYMDLWSISGQRITSPVLQSGSNTLHFDLATGLYLYRINVNGVTQWTGKVSVSSH